MTRFHVLAVALALAACAGDAQTRATESLSIACETMATTLDQLTTRKATLSADAIKKVNDAKIVTDKACAPSSPFDPAAAVGMVQNAVAIVKGL